LTARTFDELQTPCALVDLDRLESNCERMAGHVGAMGAGLRPHVKTHKCVEAARLQIRGQFGGITVSTVAEARRFARAGFRDILLAVPLAPSRADEVLELRRDCAGLAVILDHPDTLAELERCAEQRRRRIDAHLKVDCGYHRAGVDPQGELGPALARRMAASEWIGFAGVVTHAGHAYGCRSTAELAEVALQERERTVEFARRLGEAGIDVPRVSIGSTPSVVAATSLEGVDEVRPGNYAFFDAFQAGLGVCDLDDVAFSVLTSVVGRYPERDALVVDAGALALSKDAGRPRADGGVGYGVAMSPDGQFVWRDLHLASLTQEHGVVQAEEGLGPSDHPVGERLRILPNHACLAAALFEQYVVVRGEQVVDRWRPARGW